MIDVRALLIVIEDEDPFKIMGTVSEFQDVIEANPGIVACQLALDIVGCRQIRLDSLIFDTPIALLLADIEHVHLQQIIVLLFATLSWIITIVFMIRKVCTETQLALIVLRTAKRFIFAATFVLRFMDNLLF